MKRHFFLHLRRAFASVELMDDGRCVLATDQSPSGPKVDVPVEPEAPSTDVGQSAGLSSSPQRTVPLPPSPPIGTASVDVTQRLQAARLATPRRFEFLGGCVGAGLLTWEEAGRYAAGGRIGDAAFEALKQLHRNFAAGLGGEAVPTEEHSPVSPPSDGSRDFRDVRWLPVWVLEKHGGPSDLTVNFSLWVDVREELPLDRLCEILDYLAVDGWHVATVSEDRGVDSAAERSFVTSMRFLLVRA